MCIRDRSYRARRAGEPASPPAPPPTVFAGDFEPATWASVQADALVLYGDYEEPPLPDGARHGARGAREARTALGRLDGVSRASLHYMSYSHLLIYWLPRLRRIGALARLELIDCSIDSMRELYAVLPSLTRLEQLTISAEDPPAPAPSADRTPPPDSRGAHTHPMFRACAISLLPLLAVLNGSSVDGAERAVAELRCAALNRLTLEPPPAAGASAAAMSPARGARAGGARDGAAATDAVRAQSGALVSAALQHALAIEAKLRALDAQWADALRPHMQRAIHEAAGGLGAPAG